ncbi:MAG: hypothetical protein JST26_07260 [Bacteroidetes bacterium]|nr:hypothetical protein [Bacteroidota bacterium]
MAFPDKRTLKQKTIIDLKKHNGGFTEQQIQYVQGDTASNMAFELYCTNIPAGTTIGLSAPDAGPMPPVYLPPTRITNSHIYQETILSHIPGNFKTTLTVFIQSQQALPPNASLELRCYYTK